jgi:hypothetical protein
MRRVARIVLAVFTLAIAASSRGQSPAPTAAAVGGAKPNQTAVPVSESQRAAVADLFVALRLPQEVQTMPESMIDGEIARNPSLAPFRDLMVTWLKKYMTWPALEPQLTQLYASNFTEAELKSMAAFYRSPAGQKAVQKMPEMMQRTAMLGAQLSQPHSDELKKQISARAEELQKKQQGDARKEAGAAAGPPPRATAPPKKP